MKSDNELLFKEVSEKLLSLDTSQLDSIQLYIRNMLQDLELEALSEKENYK